MAEDLPEALKDILWSRRSFGARRAPLRVPGGPDEPVLNLVQEGRRPRRYHPMTGLCEGPRRRGLGAFGPITRRKRLHWRRHQGAPPEDGGGAVK